MPLPTSAPASLDAIYARIVETAQSTLGISKAMRAQIAQPLDVGSFMSLHQTLRNARAYGISVQGMPGLPDYAKTATGDPNYDILASFGAVLQAGTAVCDWIVANMPGDGQGSVIAWRLDANGDFTRLSVDPAQSAALGQLLDTLISAIEA